MAPEAPMIRSSCPARIFPRSRRKYSAVFAPNGMATASSQLSESGLITTAPVSGRHAYCACPPPAMPVEATTRSPVLNLVTSLPAPSTSPANSVPRTRSFHGFPIPNMSFAIGQHGFGDEGEIADVAVTSRHRGRVYRDQDFVVLGSGFVHLPELEKIGRSVLGVQNRFHRYSLVGWGETISTVSRTSPCVRFFSIWPAAARTLPWRALVREARLCATSKGRCIDCG